jgi:hypothetical protein
MSPEVLASNALPGHPAGPANETETSRLMDSENSPSAARVPLQEGHDRQEVRPHPAMRPSLTGFATKTNSISLLSHGKVVLESIKFVTR